VDIPDFVTQALHTPVLGGLIDCLGDVHVESRTLLQDVVERELADLATHRGLGKLTDGVFGIFNAVGSFVSIEDTDVEDSLFFQSAGKRAGGGGDKRQGQE
jgi:hypothetical protein